MIPPEGSPTRRAEGGGGGPGAMTSQQQQQQQLATTAATSLPPPPSTPVLQQPTTAAAATAAAAHEGKRSTSATRTASSAAASPLSSREASPSRTTQRPRVAGSAAATSQQQQQQQQQQRSTVQQGQRKTGGEAVQQRSNPPSAAAIQRALSAANTPQLHPSGSSVNSNTSANGEAAATRLPRAQQQGGTGATAMEGINTAGEAMAAARQTSPKRLRSPPPQPNSGSRRNSLKGSSAGGGNQANSTKKVDAAPAPSIVVQGSTPTVTKSPELLPAEGSGPLTTLEQVLAPQAAGGRAHRGERGASGAPALATVEEGSNPPTPLLEQDEAHSFRVRDAVNGGVAQSNGGASQPADVVDGSGVTKPSESGSDSAGTSIKGGKEEEVGGKANAAEPAARPKVVRPQSSYTTLASIKPSGGSGATNKSGAAATAAAGPEPAGSRKMTVETETVSSAAAPATPGDRAASVKAADASGSLRLKPSNETIRPKKDRKKSRKGPSIHSGTDIFEAKVASAIDDVDSSDSDETFVYESNPPDSQPRRSRHHSRTPSATSMASMADSRGGLRSLATVMNADRGVSGKRSMKFANNPYSSSGADDDHHPVGGGGGHHHEGGGSTLRGGTIRPSAGSGVHHHHMSRHTRGANSSNGHNGGDDDNQSSPFTLASKRSNVTSSRTSSRPSSPRLGGGGRAFYGATNGASRKNEDQGSSYDLDGDGADDERTPLMGTVRTPRSIRNSRASGAGAATSARLRQLERDERTRGYRIKRFAGCLIMAAMVAAVVLGAAGFFLLTTEPLYGVEVAAISHVLASEQELMLDLEVVAVNPNILAVSIADMDVNVFAKSKHVGSEKWWRDHGKPPPPPPSDGDDADDGDDDDDDSDSGKRKKNRKTVHTEGRPWFNFPGWGDGDDPDDDDSYRPPGAGRDAQTMLLGRVLHFDNSLTFDGSPVHRRAHRSRAELRVARPGNRTEAGGTERWEKVLQHPFQLIVRGVLKYNLPLAGKATTVAVDANVTVHPERGSDEGGDLPVDEGGEVVVAGRLSRRRGVGAPLISESPPSAKFRIRTGRRLAGV